MIFFSVQFFFHQLILVMQTKCTYLFSKHRVAAIPPPPLKKKEAEFTFTINDTTSIIFSVWCMRNMEIVMGYDIISDSKQ